MVISHFNKLRGDLVDRGALNRADRRYGRGHDYVFDCNTLFDRFTASFSKSLNDLYCNRFEELRYPWDESHYAA